MLLNGYCAYAAVAYAHMTHSVVQQICTYLDIYCLAIKKPGGLKGK
jgi:hypothetical protein